MTAMQEMPRTAGMSPLFAAPYGQQAEPKPKRIGKFYAWSVDLHAALERFKYVNAGFILEVNNKRSEVKMTDGTIYHFLVLGQDRDVMKIAGVEYYSADIHDNIGSEFIINYVKSRIRGRWE